MEIVLLLLQQNAIMLCYLLGGYIMSKKKILSVNGSADIGKMLLYFIMPVSIIKSYMREFSPDSLVGFMVSFLAAAAALLIAIVISAAVFHSKSAIRAFGAAFSNAGFIGIPLVQMTIGEEAVFYVASFVALLNILQWTYGVYLITGDTGTIRLKKIVTNPIVISLLIGLLFFFLPIQLPDILTNVIGTVASMNGPLAMIVLGTYLAQVRLKELFTDKESYLCAAVRLVLIPVVTIFVLLLVPEKLAMIRLSIMIVAAAPVGSNVAIFAQIYQKDYKMAVKDVCMSTILSIFTMPLVIALADMVLL